MNLKLGIVFTNNQLPKVGYLTFVDDQLYRITSTYIAEDGNEFANLISIFDRSPYVLNINELRDRYIKFIAIHDKVMYSIIHGDYPEVTRFISKTFKDNAEDCDKCINDLINSNTELEINGFIKKIYCRVSEKDIVEIINLKLIDNYKLLDKRDRLFNIDSKVDSGVNTRYILKSGNIIINTNRDSFKLVGSPNYKSLFSVNKNKNEIKY